MSIIIDKEQSLVLNELVKAIETKNKSLLIRLSSTLKKSTREELITIYNKINKKNLSDLIKSKMRNNNFRICIERLFTSSIDYDCMDIKESIGVFSNDNDTIIEIICSKKCFELRKISERFQKLYEKSLEEYLSKIDSEIKRVLIDILRSVRKDNSLFDCYSLNEIVYEIENIHHKKSKDYSIFHHILLFNSVEEIRYINKRIIQKMSKNLLSVIEEVMTGNLEKIYSTIAFSLLNPIAYYSVNIRKACKGLGTNNNMLIKSILNRSGKELRQIDSYYKKNYNMNLIAQVIDETSGEYQELLIEVLKNKLKVEKKFIY